MFYHSCFLSYRFLPMLLIAGDCRSVIYKFPFIYGTVQRHFLPLIFLGIGSSQAPFSSSEGFLNLTSNLRYSRFLIDFLLLFIAESQDSLYCLIRRVASFVTGSYKCMNYVQKHRESRFPVLFNTASHYSAHCLQQKSLLTAGSHF
jgi:hypothetical protein